MGEVIQSYYTIAYHEFSTFNPQPINVESLEKEERELKDIYQCQDCFTIYDAQYGDESQGIKQGTDFEQLPESFKCPVCESTKESYKLVADESIDQLN